MGNKRSNPALEKLLAADAELGSQAAKLTAQLDVIQTKRASLKTVLEIFTPDKTTAADRKGEAAPSQRAEAAIDSPAKKPAKESSRQPATATTDSPTKPRKAARRAKSLRRGWQKYMRDEYLQTPLPTVVASILKSQPQKVFEIAEVVNSIVVKAIPHTARKGARNRISNILSEGARKHQWRRLKEGRYCFSQEAG